MALSLRIHRKVLVIFGMVVVAVVTAIAVSALYMRVTDMDSPKMGDFGPGKQREWADKLIAGFNTHDPDQLPLIHEGHLPDAQRRSVEAVMPGRNCHYDLVSVTDRGNQGRLPTPDLTGEIGTWRFDMTVEERCPDTNRTRVIGVMSIAEMGFYDPYYFVE